MKPTNKRTTVRLNLNVSWFPNPPPPSLSLSLSSKESKMEKGLIVWSGKTAMSIHRAVNIELSVPISVVSSPQSPEVTRHQMCSTCCQVECGAEEQQEPSRYFKEKHGNINCQHYQQYGGDAPVYICQHARLKNPLTASFQVEVGYALISARLQRNR